MPRKIVIIGGVAGGATAAARLRRLDEEAEIVIVERGEHISFANCGLPYHVGGVIAKREQLLLLTPRLMNRRFNVDVRVQSEAVRIDRAAHHVEIKNLATGEVYLESYDHLILATGARPVKPPIPGVDLPSVLTLRSIPDMDAIIAAADAREKGHAVVVGGGFIGLETAENLMKRGLQVTLVEMADQVMTPIDRELAAIVQNHIRSHGVNLFLQEKVTAFGQEGERTRVILGSGRSLTADLVIMATGVRPESELAQAAGLEIGPRRGVVVNDQLLTSDPDISAVGDVAEPPAFGAEGTTWVPLAGPANRQARLVADRLAGRPIRYTGIQGSSIAKVFDLTVAATGKNSAALVREGREFRAIVTGNKQHAGYYPGAEFMALKLLFSPADGKVLGAQAVGPHGVDKRMDVLATAIRFGATIDQLADLELCYAPPFGAAKDPVNMLGYAAGNALRGDTPTVTWEAVMDFDPEQVTLLDVREYDERAADRIEGSVHIPLNLVRQKAERQLPREKPVIVYCGVGQRGHTVVRFLRQKGYDARNLMGGIMIYAAMRDDLKAIAAQASEPAKA